MTKIGIPHSDWFDIKTNAFRNTNLSNKWTNKRATERTSLKTFVYNLQGISIN